MSKFLISLTAAGAAAAGAVGFAVPAEAQSGPGGEGIGYVIVYGNDPCPRSTDDEVVVCARKPETERYRIPQRYRESGPLQTRQAWARKAKSFEYVGRTGTMSCSAVGPGGYTGCLQNMIDRAEAERNDAEREAVPPPEYTPPGW
jgi:hypothetical protein